MTAAGKPKYRSPQLTAFESKADCHSHVEKIAGAARAAEVTEFFESVRGWSEESSIPLKLRRRS